MLNQSGKNTLSYIDVVNLSQSWTSLELHWHAISKHSVNQETEKYLVNIPKSKI